MQGLEKGINLIANQETNKKVRDHTIHLLDEIIADIKSGIDVWDAYVNNGSDTAKGLFGGWAGSDMESKLFNIHLGVRAKAMDASRGEASLDDSLIEMAYSKLQEDQSGRDVANNAINCMQERIAKIGKLIELIRNTKPSAPKAAKPVKAAGGKASSGAKSTSTKQAKAGGKPTVKKKTQAKLAAKKKSSAKQAASKKARKTSAKKSAKKSSAKTVPKKRLTKKSTKKKSAAKKAPAKKKTAAKKAAKKAAKRKK